MKITSTLKWAIGIALVLLVVAAIWKYGGSDSTPNVSSSAAKLAPAHTYAQILVAIPSWDKAVLSQVTDDQLIMLIIGGALVGSYVVSWLSGLITAFGSWWQRTECDGHCSHKNEEQTTKDWMSDHLDNCKTEDPASPRDYTYVQGIVSSNDDDDDAAELLEFASEALKSEDLTKGDVGRVIGLVQANKVNTPS